MASAIFLFFCNFIIYFTINGIANGFMWNRFSYVYEASDPDSFWFAVVFNLLVATIGDVFIIVALIKAWKKGILSRKE